jgi:hypothetical protein
VGIPLNTKFVLWLGEMSANLTVKAACLLRIPLLLTRLLYCICVWKFLTSDEHWAQLNRARFLHHGKPKEYYLTSSIWPGMKQFVHLIHQNGSWSVGNGEKIHFWTDKWLDVPIVDHWHIPLHMHKSLQMLVADYVVNGSWSLPEYFIHKDGVLADKILKVIIPLEMSLINLTGLILLILEAWLLFISFGASGLKEITNVSPISNVL